MSEYGKIGPYVLKGELGRGAMAVVWRAWDPNLEREVAVKEPLFDQRLPENVIEEMGRRFVAEGRAAARLNHPGIVSIYAADVWDGRPAIVMELVNGETLTSLLKGGPLSPPEALAVLDQLLDAVGYAHERGVIHRDIKPDNVFVTLDGAIKLADFGIAHVDGTASTATLAGTVLGTPGYMSPEQAAGAPVDERSDLFSVGVLAWELLTGHNPFGAGEGADAPTVIYRIVHEPAPELPVSVSAGLPADMRPAIMAALSKDPAMRPQSAAEFRAMLRGQAPVPAAAVAPAAIPTGRQASSGGMRWLPYAVVAVAAVVALGLMVANAMGVVGGGGASTASPQVQTEQAQTAGADAGAEAPSTIISLYYLAVSNGCVAIFSNSSATPYEVTDVQVADLGSDTAAALDNHVPASSIDEAEGYVEQYRQEAQATREAREEQERAKAEAEAAAAAQAAREREIQDNPFKTSYTQCSSSLAMTPSNSYWSDNVTDRSFSTVWCEGAGSVGIGEWVSINAADEQWLRGVRVVNGHPTNSDIYYRNCRCKDVLIQLSDGYEVRVRLDDVFNAWQEIDFGEYHQTSYVRITIESVYEGVDKDTSIAEIEAY